MMSLFGAILVVAGCSGVGFVCARRFAERPAQLRQLQAAMELLETDISYRAQLLPLSFNRISRQIQGPIATAFAETARLLEMGQGHSAEECWQSALRHCRHRASLNKDDWEVLYQLGHNLGTSNQEDQVRNLRAVLRRLQLQESLAREQQQRYERLTRSLGVLFGLCLAILMF